MRLTYRVSPETPTDSTQQSGQTGTAFCFRVRQERLGWNLLQPVPTKTTIDLAALVCGAPEFLGMDNGVAPCQAAVLLSERGESRLVTAVDEAGTISLVGCPTQQTRGALTTVVQELLMFTGRLWRMPPDEFSSVIEKKLGHSLIDYFSSRAAIGWSENGFRAGLAQSLERGHFPIVLLLAEANREVAEVVAHLKSHNLEVKSLGVALYESQGVEIVMPRVLTVDQSNSNEDREPAEMVSRPTPPQPRVTPRSQPSTVRAANPGVSGSQVQPEAAPIQTRPWSGQPAPSVPLPEAPTVEESVEIVELDTAEQVADIEPPPVESKPVTSVPPPAARSAPAARPVWDGTMPGVMAGKRPPRKVPQDSETHKGHEHTTGRR